MDRIVYEKTPSRCYCTNIRRATRALTKFYDETITASGLKSPQLSLLNHLKRLGPLSITDLSREIRLERTTLVRNLKPLVERGFVADAPGKNARVRRVRITEAGLEVVEKALPLWNEAQGFFENYLGDEDIVRLNKLLSKIERLVK